MLNVSQQARGSRSGKNVGLDVREEQGGEGKRRGGEVSGREGRGGNWREGKGREGQGREGKRRGGTARAAQVRSGEGMGREKRQGKGRKWEGKGDEGKGGQIDGEDVENTCEIEGGGEKEGRARKPERLERKGVVIEEIRERRGGVNS